MRAAARRWRRWRRIFIPPSSCFGERPRPARSISSAIPWAGCWRGSISPGYRPQRLGRVVMLGTPNGGSEIADRLKHIAAYRAFFGPAGQQLGTQRDAAIEALFPPVDYPVGIIAGDRSIDPIRSALLPKPHDGRVSVANTRLDGMADHVVIGTIASLAGAESSCDRADDCVFAGWEISSIVGQATGPRAGRYFRSGEENRGWCRQFHADASQVRSDPCRRDALPRPEHRA